MRYTKIIATLLATCSLLALLVSAYYLDRYHDLKQSVVQTTAREAMHHLGYSEREYQGLKQQFDSTIRLLAQTQSLHDYIYLSNGFNKSRLQSDWALMVRNQKWYLDIRYLTVEGDELVRVGYIAEDEQIEMSSEQDNATAREFFQFAQTLQDDQVGTLGIREGDEHSAGDTKPSLKIMTPVLHSGVRKGYLVLNVDVGYLASKLIYSPNREYSPELVSSDGNYLTHELNNPLFSELANRGHQLTLKQDLPRTWAKMNSQPSGYLVENGEMTAFNRLNISVDSRLFLIIHLSEQEIMQRYSRDFNDLYQEAIFVLLILVIFALPISSAAIYYHKRNIESQLARAALNGMSAMMISDRLHRTVLVNGEFSRLTGYLPNQLVNKNVLKLLLGEDKLDDLLMIFEKVASKHLWEGEINFRSATTGSEVTAIMRIQAVMSKRNRNKVSYYITSLVDISDRKLLEQRLRTLSEKDSLTQLWNRRKFEAELQRMAKLTNRYPQVPCCLALVDIDHFKRINDEKGHDAGDRVINLVGNSMARQLRETDFVARIGGEEFAAIMPNTSLQEAGHALERLRLAIEQDSHLGVTISIGYTDMTEDSTRSYKCADIALYESKTLGRNQLSLCSSTDDLA
ncbi:diguanylate cyclase [Vibrio sp.]|uniref:sensor domain-containing diguanylate cyclase n=1 Tax=Vibrio sp. TaxID=678 RepID=UPI003D0C11A6